MNSFREYLNESYINIFTSRDKEKYKQQVFNILQQSYAAIGGLKGSGFKDPDDMVKNIPFWKLDVFNGKVVAVVMYKNKGGRKSVAIGSDGSARGKLKIVETLREDLSRSFGEKSKAALTIVMRSYPIPEMEYFLKTPEEAANILGVSVTPIDASHLPDDAVQLIKKFPILIKYGYVREIGGKLLFKVLLGSPNIKII